MTDSAPNPLEEAAAALRARFPGWRAWWVPRAGRGAFWSAQPGKYPLIAGSADELAALIEADQAGQDPPAG